MTVGKCVIVNGISDIDVVAYFDPPVKQWEAPAKEALEQKVEALVDFLESSHNSR